MLQNIKNLSISVLLETESKLNNPKYTRIFVNLISLKYAQNVIVDDLCTLWTPLVKRLPILVGTANTAHLHQRSFTTNTLYRSKTI